MRSVVHILFITLLTSNVCLSQTPAPIISFEKTHHDFGKISQDIKLSYKYKMTNKGNAPLNITEVRPSCGCSYSIVGKWYLNPSEITFIEVYFDPAGMMGNIHKPLDVFSDDPSSPKTVLTFEANIVREIMANKTVVIFDGISRSSTASASIRLQSGNEQPVIVTDAVFSHAPFLSCVQQKNGNDVTLNVSIDGRLIPQEKRRGVNVLTVHTTNKKIPAMQFHIQWNVAQTLVTANPKRIIWTGAAGAERRTTIHLKHSAGKPFRVMGVKSTSSLIKVLGITKNNAVEHKFDVILSAKAKRGGYKELLTLKLDEPEQNKLEINISAVLK